MAQNCGIHRHRLWARFRLFRVDAPELQHRATPAARPASAAKSGAAILHGYDDESGVRQPIISLQDR